MPVYSYIAIDDEGREQKGTLDADDQSAARLALIELGLEPVEITAATQPDVTTDDVSEDSGGVVVGTISPSQETDKEHAVAFSTEQTADQQQFTPSEEDPVEEAEPMVDFQRQSDDVISVYHPLVDTFRLYAGWLLAWLGVIYLFHGYTSSRDLTFTIPFVGGFSPSAAPGIFQLGIGTFLFLLLSSIHRLLGGGITKGILCSLLGAGLFVVYRINI